MAKVLSLPPARVTTTCPVEISPADRILVKTAPFHEAPWLLSRVVQPAGTVAPQSPPKNMTQRSPAAAPAGKLTVMLEPLAAF